MKLKISRWDRFLMGAFPRWGVRRLQAKASAVALARTFDAAGRGRRQAGWRRSSGDANATNGPHLATLRELARDLVRNNGWAQRAVWIIANNTVGWGIEANAETDRPLSAKRAVDVWEAWAGSTACDFEGRLSFSGIQWLVAKTMCESGEVLILRKTPLDTNSLGLPVPLQLRVCEPDLLDSSRDGAVEGGGYIMQGIEFDKQGRRVAYWLFPRHPGGQIIMQPSLQSRRVPAADVLHIYRMDRPGQSRGVPWLASAIAKLQDLEDYADAKLMQQKIAACFAAFVQNVDGVTTTIGKQSETDSKIEELEPGQISYLSPGESVSFATPPGADDGNFTVMNLRRIAAGLGITYEELATDYSQVNFSSARMARISHYAHVHDWRWNILIPQLCDPVWRWVMDSAMQLQLIRSVPPAAWYPPPMPMLEPEKEGLAYQRLMRSGAMTLYGVLRERGENPSTHLAELAAVNKELDRLGIVLDSDPRRTTSTGQAQQMASEADDESSSESQGDNPSDDPPEE